MTHLEFEPVLLLLSPYKPRVIVVLDVLYVVAFGMQRVLAQDGMLFAVGHNRSHMVLHTRSLPAHVLVGRYTQRDTVNQEVKR